MVKKITCFCISLCMTLVLIIPVQAQAAANAISSNTIITKDNISQVLKYLGIDSSNVIKTNVTEKSVQTVGQLENAIGKFQKSQNQINATGNFNHKTTSSSTSFNAIAASSGTLMLYSSLDMNDYTLNYEVSAQYSGSYWTGTSYAAVSVDSDFIPYTFKITSQSLNLSYNSSTITLHSTVVVGMYIGIAGYGLVKIGSNTVSGYDYFYASDYL